MEQRFFQVRTRIRFVDQDVVVYGNGISQLLLLTSQTGSVHAAAKQMGLSYPKALKIIKRAEEHLQQKLIIKKIGGEEGGGSVLTDFGKEFLEKFEKMKQEVSEYSLLKAKEYFPDFITPAQN